MPVTLISIRKPRPPAERAALIEAVQAAMVETLRVPAHDRCVRLQVLAADDFVVTDNDENYTLIEISLYPGRTLDAKRAFYQRCVANLDALGIPPLAVRIILNEVPSENWGLRGGWAGCDL